MTASGDGEAEGDYDDSPQLEAYRRQKWAELHDEGEERLYRELARLEDFLAAVDRGEDPYQGRVMEVDVGWRRAKARVLRKILAELGDDG